ncbi:MAG: DUF4827 domain-containing protein [Tannerella sp.]|jgi:hypothetical protein|nr:DUF4827 domain-containing protein [Tannerella sp.]
MKKRFCFFAIISCLFSLVFGISCSDDVPTYEELKAAENKIIKRMIANKGIEVLSDYPDDGVFKENQFVQLTSGIYLNVVDSGNGNRAQVNFTDILVRTSGEYYYPDSLVPFTTFTNSSYPMEFKYGMAYNIVQRYAYNGWTDPYYMFFSTGLESVLSYVGDSSIVKLIVPGYSEVNGAQGGSTYQSENTTVYYPIYYDKIRYIFY